MNDQKPQSDNRLERALRLWGAETDARRESRHLPLDEPAPSSGGATWTLLRAMAVAAAAVIVFAAGMFVYRIINPGDPRIVERRVEVPATGPGEAEVRRLKDELAQATESVRQSGQTLAQVQTELKTARDDLAMAADDAKAAAAGHTRQIDQLKADFQKQLAAAGASSPNAARLAEQVRTLATELADARKRLVDAEAAVVRVQREAETRQGEAEARGNDLAKRLSAATEELARVTEAMQRNAEASRTAAKELAAVKAAQTAMLTRFGNLYLAGAAPELHGLAARQAAARKAQLLRRVAAVRTTTRSDATRRLLDRVETVLTRLELLNPDDPRDADAFGRMVSGDLMEQIDAVLASAEAPSVREVLLEARITLTEDDHAG